MRKCKTDYTKLKTSGVHALCAGVIESLRGNKNFPDLPFSLPSLSSANEKLETVMAMAGDQGRSDLAAVRKEKRAVTLMLRDTAAYINLASKGNELLLLSSGFKLNSVAEKNRKPTQVTRLKAIFTNKPGTIELCWKHAHSATFYKVFVSNDNGVTWILSETVFGRKMLCKGLPGGIRYQLKVVGVNRHGSGPESSIASQIAG